MSACYLIRHGEIPRTSPRQFVGSQDPALTETGRQQILGLTEFLKSRGIDRVVTSPLVRCFESAQILCTTLQLPLAEPVPALKAINLGAWEGLTVEEVERKFPGQYAARGTDIPGFRPTGGESFIDLCNMSWPAFLVITGQATKSLAIVAHAGVNRMILCQILGMPFTNLFRLEQQYGCVNIIAIDRRGYRLQALNHLPQRDFSE
jgi:broad specificity phosphatase PhoE